MNIIIRRATKMDYSEVAEIHKQLHEMHGKAHPERFRQTNVTMSLDKYCNLLIQDDAAIFAAEIANKVVGFAMVSINIKESTQLKYVEIDNIGVLEVYYRFGIGSELFKACAGWAKDKGISELELKVFEFNKNAIAFYENMGMETLSRKMTMKLD